MNDNENQSEKWVLSVTNTLIAQSEWNENLIEVVKDLNRKIDRILYKGDSAWFVISPLYLDI